MMAGNDVNDKVEVYFLNEGSTVFESDSAWVGTGYGYLLLVTCEVDIKFFHVAFRDDTVLGT